MLFGKNNFFPYGGGSYSPKKSIEWGGLLDNTQKTLGIVNQVIPLVYQFGPILKNTKTMFKVASELKKTDSTPKRSTFSSTSQPSFFV